MYPDTSHAVIGELTSDGRTIILMATGADYEVAYAANVVQTLTPLIQPTRPPGALQMPVTWPAVVQLAHAFGEFWKPGPRLTEWIVREHATRVEALTGGLTIGLSEGLVLRPYQHTGALILGAFGSAVLTDEMGTGKTVTTLAGLAEREARGYDVLPMVIVAPGSVVDVWLEHIATWTPHWRAIDWRGPGRFGQAADIYVTSYDTARMDASDTSKPLARLKPVTVVVDEHHYVKNHEAKRTKAVTRLTRTASNVVALSGTPISHDSADWWATLNMVFPHAWPSIKRWRKRYCLMLEAEYGEDKIIGLDRTREPELRVTMLGQHRRVAKADVLDQLPPKIHSVRYVELPSEWRKAYDDFEDEMLAQLPDGGGKLTVMDVVAKVVHLTLLASAAADVRITEEWDEERQEYRKHYHLDLKAPSWKVDALVELMAERDKPVVVFAPSRQLTMLAGKTLVKAGYQVGYVVGGQSPGDRKRNVEEFQDGKLDVLMVTTGAGGVGLTLTAADCCVFLQRPWSLVDAIQAEDRLHRIGAEVHDSIEVVDIVAKDTIDSRIREALRSKAGQLAELVADPRIVRDLLGGGKK